MGVLRISWGFYAARCLCWACLHAMTCAPVPEPCCSLQHGQLGAVQRGSVCIRSRCAAAAGLLHLLCFPACKALLPCILSLVTAACIASMPIQACVSHAGMFVHCNPDDKCKTLQQCTAFLQALLGWCFMLCGRACQSCSSPGPAWLCRSACPTCCPSPTMRSGCGPCLPAFPRVPSHETHRSPTHYHAAHACPPAILHASPQSAQTYSRYRAAAWQVCQPHGPAALLQPEA